MAERKHFGAALSDDPDDAPELLQAFFEDAEIREDGRVVRPRQHGSSTPAHETAQVTLNLDTDVLEMLHRTGPGGEGRLNTAMRAWLELGEPQSGA